MKREQLGLPIHENGENGVKDETDQHASDNHLTDRIGIQRRFFGIGNENLFFDNEHDDEAKRANGKEEREASG